MHPFPEWLLSVAIPVVAQGIATVIGIGCALLLFVGFGFV